MHPFRRTSDKKHTALGGSVRSLILYAIRSHSILWDQTFFISADSADPWLDAKLRSALAVYALITIRY